MISGNNFKPLVEVGIQYTRDINPKLSDNEWVSVRTIFEKFIDGLETFTNSSMKFKDIVGTVLPLEKVNTILNIKCEPLSNSSENCEKSQLMASQVKKKTNPWTENEDQRLLCAINKYGLDNWSSVSNFVGNSRTRGQCSQRWFRGLDPRIVKEIWNQEEEDKLISLVQKHGERCWTRIAFELGNRSDAQCRYHYKQIQKDKVSSPYGISYVVSNPPLSTMYIPTAISQNNMNIKRAVYLPPIGSYIYPSLLPHPTNNPNPTNFPIQGSGTGYFYPKLM